jgi:transposase-like protein
MGRKPRVDRSPEEKWQIVQEGLKSGNVSETCRRHGIAPNLFYRWKDEAERGVKAAVGWEERCGRGDREGSWHPAAGTSAATEVAGDRDPKKRRWEVSWGEVHSQARALVAEGYTPTRGWQRLVLRGALQLLLYVRVH